MSITHIPESNNFSCDAAGCEESVNIAGSRPWESTPEGWVTLRIINPAGGVPTFAADQRRLLCPTHSKKVLEAIAKEGVCGA